jgi:hypothetical protein
MAEADFIIRYQGDEVADVKSRTIVAFLDTILEPDGVEQCDTPNIST